MKNSKSSGYSGSYEGEILSQCMRMPYHAQPDYSRPLLEIPGKARERMMGRLRFLYGEAAVEEYMSELERILRVHYAHKPGK